MIIPINLGPSQNEIRQANMAALYEFDRHKNRPIKKYETKVSIVKYKE